MPLVSIIYVSYNNGDAIVRSLVSLEQQTFRDFEVVIVDDGSTDNTVGLIEKYQSLFPPFPVSLIKQQGHLGGQLSQSKALANCRGHFVHYAEAEILPPARIENFVEVKRASEGRIEKRIENRIIKGRPPGMGARKEKKKRRITLPILK